MRKIQLGSYLFNILLSQLVICSSSAAGIFPLNFHQIGFSKYIWIHLLPDIFKGNNVCWRLCVCGQHYTNIYLELSLRKYLLTSYHGLINYFDIKAKCRPLKILTCEGTSWQFFAQRGTVQCTYSVLVGCCSFGPSFVAREEPF